MQGEIPFQVEQIPTLTIYEKTPGGLPPGAFVRITDAGDTRTTDAGDTRITA